MVGEVTEEHCMVHLVSKRFKPCSSRDIAVYIFKQGRRIPLCWNCWKKIAESNLEW